MSFTLTGQPRERVGSRHSRALRAEGRIPCNIQGAGGANTNFSIERHQFLSARRKHEHLFDIELGGDEPETALVRELQYDAFGDDIIHVEFRRVIRGQEIETDVELRFVGHAAGGILNHLVTHVTIATIPSKVPDALEVPVGDLEQGQLLRADAIEMPEGVRLVTDPETPIANLASSRGLDVDEDTDEEEGEGEGAEETPDSGS